MTELTVLDPIGLPPKVTGRGLAPPLGALTGKTVFLVDEPGVRTKVVRWRTQHAPDPDLWNRIRAEGDAAFLGVGT